MSLKDIDTKYSKKNYLLLSQGALDKYTKQRPNTNGVENIVALIDEAISGREEFNDFVEKIKWAEMKTVTLRQLWEARLLHNINTTVEEEYKTG